MDLVSELIPATISRFADATSTKSTPSSAGTTGISETPGKTEYQNNQQALGIENSSSAQSSLENLQASLENLQADNLHLSPQIKPIQAIDEGQTEDIVTFSRESIWAKCLDGIRRDLDAQIFSAWIRPLSLLECTPSQKVIENDDIVVVFSAVIGVRNKFALDHVQRHYADAIANALASVLNADSLSLSFRVEKAIAALPVRPQTRALNPVGNTVPSSGNSSAFNGSAFAASAAQGVLNSGGTLRDENFSGKLTLDDVRLQKISEETNLNPKYNFSNFVVGSCNQFAHAACLRVSETPGSNYNPLFIYGGVGLGKTHLANAIGNSIRRQNKKVLLVSSEGFVSELIASLRSNRMQQFKEKFRTLDLLIIDDVQFLIGKERTQEEFFHTFNDLYNRRKQIIITSDTVPQELSGVEERLRTRFACGLTVDLQVPDFETRVAILSKKAEAAGVFLSPDVARHVAEGVNTNVRELEGAFNRLQALASLRGGSLMGGKASAQCKEITLDIAQEVIRDFKPRRQKEVSTEIIQRTVAERYSVSITDLLGKRRTHNVAIARQIAMYFCRKLTTYSYPEIGAYFGGRDHSTVIHSYRSIEEKIQRDKDFALTLEQIQQTICE